MNHANPLLDFSALPRFAGIRPTHVAPAIDILIAEARATVARVVADDSPPDWDHVVSPLEQANERLARAWGIVGHLHAVIDSPELRDAYNDNLPKVTEYWTDLGQNLQLFLQPGQSKKQRLQDFDGRCQGRVRL